MNRLKKYIISLSTSGYLYPLIWEGNSRQEALRIFNKYKDREYELLLKSEGYYHFSIDLEDQKIDWMIEEKEHKDRRLLKFFAYRDVADNNTICTIYFNNLMQLDSKIKKGS